MNQNNLKIALGSDHAGFELKSYLSEILTHEGHEITDFGTNSSESVDYPDFAHQLSSHLIPDSYDFGILICGSGVGMSIAANRHEGVRAALCWEPEIGKLARQHNNANILCLPSRFIDKKTALEIIRNFFTTAFEGGRHENRVRKLEC